MSQTELIKEIQELISCGRFKEAQVQINKYKSEEGTSDTILYEEALLNIYNKDYLESLRNCQIGLQYNIYNSKLYSVMGLVFEKLKKSNMAYLSYEQAEFLAINDKQDINTPKELDDKESDYSKVNVKGLSIIIIAKDNFEYTKICIEAIKRYVYKGTYEIILVDYNISDIIAESLKIQVDDNIKVVTIKEDKGFLLAYNEALLKVQTNNDVLILNNNAIVMPNSVLNLKMALYSSNKIGAVGCVSNKASNEQKIEALCKSFKEYVEFACKNNISGSHTYKEKSVLDSVGILIRGEVLQKVVPFNGDFEAKSKDDASFVIPMKEYQMVSSADSFIYRL